MKKVLAGCLLMCLFVAGCGSSSDESASSDATSTSPASAQNAAPAVVETIEVTFKVNGVARGIVGTYTGATGADVAIPASVAASGSEPSYMTLPWETKVSIPLTIMRGQQIKLSAKDAFGSDAQLTVEMWAEGRQLTSASGSEPSIFVQKH